MREQLLVRGVVFTGHPAIVTMVARAAIGRAQTPDAAYAAFALARAQYTRINSSTPRMVP